MNETSRYFADILSVTVRDHLILLLVSCLHDKYGISLAYVVEWNTEFIACVYF
jgi:hypothetical protein